MRPWDSDGGGPGAPLGDWARRPAAAAGGPGPGVAGCSHPNYKWSMDQRDTGASAGEGESHSQLQLESLRGKLARLLEITHHFQGSNSSSRPGSDETTMFGRAVSGISACQIGDMEQVCRQCSEGSKISSAL